MSERKIIVVEVGPRDGLQNEQRIVPTAVKIAFIEALAAAGLSAIEATSFVSPAAVPQLADAAEVMRRIHRLPSVTYSALVPNERGFDRALEAGVDAIALFTSATEAFAAANIRCTIDESFSRFDPVVARARASNLMIRGYVSVAFDCPYSGKVEPRAAIDVALRLFDLGCDEVSIADTIGSATPDDVRLMLDLATRALPPERIALHFHDTHGQAIDNIAVALESDIRTFDAAAGGLGGCPFAPGAPGNLATEQLVAFLHSQGVQTGVDGVAVETAVVDLRHSLESTAPAQEAG